MRAIVFGDGGFFVAQCVDYDICAQGISAIEAIRRLAAAIAIESRVGFESIGKPPSRFESMWEAFQE